MHNEMQPNETDAFQNFQVDYTAPIAAPVDLITVQTCSNQAMPQPSACVQLADNISGIQYSCYVQSEDNKFEATDFNSPDLSCFEIGSFTLVDGASGCVMWNVIADM